MLNKYNTLIKNNYYQKYLVIVAFLIVVICMGTNYIFITLTNIELPTFWSGSLRYLMTALLLFTFCKLKNLKLPSGKILLFSLIYGLLAYGINAGLLYWALNYISSSIASVVYSTIPLSTLLFASIFKLEKLQNKSIVSSVAVISGITIIFSNNINSDIQITPIIGILLASLSAAFSTIIVKQLPQHNPMAFNTVAMLSGGVVLLLVSLYCGETIVIPTHSATYMSLSWLVISSLLMSSLFLWLIKHSSVSKISYSSVLSPVVTIASTVFLGSQTIQPIFLVGTGVILASMSFHLLQNNSEVNKY